MDDHSVLKGLQAQKKRLREKADELRRQAKEINQSINHLSSKEKELDRNIAAIAKREIVVSEHAILRFLSRSMGINLDAVKKSILPDCVRAQIETLGDGQYPTPNGCKIRVVNRVVVTVLDDNKSSDDTE